MIFKRWNNKVKMSKKNIPNILSFIRILLIPFIIFFIFNSDSKSYIWAFLLFSIAAFTDFLDGFIARSTDSITEFGKILDPFADRLLIISLLICLLMIERISLIGTIIVVARDIFIVIGYLILMKRDEYLAVSILGKISTLILMISIAILLLKLYPYDIYIFYVACCLSLLSGIDYLIKFNKLLKNEDK
jgi:CDP-diacylglycerol--glycerol-3-phosphate 3-phosphatidyltransferase